MNWKAIAIIGMIATFFGGMLMLSEYVFLGDIIMPIGISMMALSMVTPEKW